MSIPMWRRLAVLLVLAAAAACRRRPADVYPPEVVQNFMTSCTTRAEARICRCALDALQRRFPLEQFRALDGRLSAGEMAPELVDAVAGCRG
jgi:hypothetical protein